MLCLSVCLVFTSCDKDDNNGSGSSSISKIEVSINNNDIDDDIDEIRAEIDEDEIASCKYTNGKFTLELPETVAAKYLYYLREDMPEGINLSDMDAKIADIYIEAYDDKDDNVGCFEYKKETSNSLAVTFYMYVDRDVRITGSFTETEDGVNYIFNANANLKKGWNFLYQIMSGNESNGTIEMTTTEPSGMKWVYDSYYSHKSAQVKSADFSKKFKSLQMFKK